MNKFKVEAKIINKLVGDKIPLPTYATQGAAGMDIRACIEEPTVVNPGETKVINSGIAVNIYDPGLMAVLVPRSGLGTKQGIVLGNLVGIIDSDYQGEILISIWNRGSESFVIHPGDRLCQLLFVPVVQVEFDIVSQFCVSTERGEGGLGHTGYYVPIFSWSQWTKGNS